MTATNTARKHDDMPMPAGPAQERWMTRLAGYRTADNPRATFELAVTIAPYLACWIAMWALMKISFWAALPLTVPASLVLIRLFIVQHDCGHQSMFSSRKVNNWVGRAIGVLTMTPYSFWRDSHAMHHATSGNLDRRGFGDVDTLTVEEYYARGPIRRLLYRAFRHPFIMFGVGPAYLFLLQQRFVIGGVKQDFEAWKSVMGTNLGIAIIAFGAMAFMGWWQYLVIQCLIIAITASMGVWLFYVQHQFEDTFWARNDEWTHEDGALKGSSYYDLPGVLKWFSGNIGIHHVHHVSSRIAFYRLPQVLKDHPELQTIGRMTLLESFKCARLKLWDEANKRMVTFREAREARLAAPVAG